MLRKSRVGQKKIVFLEKKCVLKNISKWINIGSDTKDVLAPKPLWISCAKWVYFYQIFQSVKHLNGTLLVLTLMLLCQCLSILIYCHLFLSLLKDFDASFFLSFFFYLAFFFFLFLYYVFLDLFWSYLI